MYEITTSTMTATGFDLAPQTAGIGPELYERWICFIDAKPKTIETYTRAIRQFMKWTAAAGIREPQREDIIAYRDYLKTTHKPTTVQNYMAAVRLFFRWTSQEGIYPNIADRIKGAKIDPGHKKDYLTSGQAKNLLAAVDTSTIKGKRDLAILSLMATTGLRTISIALANIEDLRTAGDSTALYYQGKGHDEKAIYVKVPGPVEAAIRDYLKARGPADPGDPLFVSEAHRNEGSRLTTRSISRLVKDHLIAAGLNSDRLTAHSLRHTAATLNLLNGATLEETQQLLNHSKLDTTLIYSHALDRANNNSEARIAAAIFG